MSSRKVSVESLPLTPELAAQFAGLTPLPGERALRNTRRNFLAAQLLRDKFTGPDWADGLCLDTGIVYRLDGQHSSDLLAHLPVGAEFPTGLLATITHYEFNSLADAADVFNYFNNPRSVRNAADVMGVYRAQVPGLEDYSREFLVDVANGFYEYERQRSAKGAQDALLYEQRDRGMYFAMRPDVVELAHWFAEFRDLKNASFLHRAFIVSEMVGHRVANRGLAEEFWPLVFTEGHSDPDHETRELAETYREALAGAAKPKLDPTFFRKKSRKAWKQFASVTAAA